MNNWEERKRSQEKNNTAIRKQSGSCNNILHVNGNSFCLDLIKALCTRKLSYIHTIFVSTYYIPDTILGTTGTKTKP